LEDQFFHVFSSKNDMMFFSTKNDVFATKNGGLATKN
jgi:hypothetical protein